MTRKDIAIAGATAIAAGGLAVAVTEVERGTMAQLGLNAVSYVSDSMTSAPEVDSHLRIVPMDVMMIPVIGESGVVTIIQIQLELQSMTPEGEGRLRTFLPRLNDAFVSDMHAFLPRLATTKTRPAPAIIGQRLKIIADRAIGAGALTGIEVKAVVDATRRS